MNSEKIRQWNIKLRVSSEEERKIKKEAIDHDMRVAEYIRLKVLANSSISTQGKSI